LVSLRQGLSNGFPAGAVTAVPVAAQLYGPVGVGGKEEEETSPRRGASFNSLPGWDDPEGSRVYSRSLEVEGGISIRWDTN
jgi:hypothetical protein